MDQFFFFLLLFDKQLNFLPIDFVQAVGKDLFSVVREKYKEKLSSFLSQKVRVVAGDITCHHLGVQDSDLLQDMWKQLDVVVNIAATTNFDERSLHSQRSPNIYITKRKYMEYRIYLI